MPRTQRAPRTVTASAPGKLNLHFGVGARGADGYHDVTSIYQAVSLVERVTVSASADRGIEVSGRDADAVPLDDTNLAWRAARLLAEHTGRDEGFHISIRKAVPVAGGMGGGSADAAAALVACDALWRTGLGRPQLRELAGALGADVPFALHGGTALGLGRGDELTPVLVRGTYHWVLAISGFGLGVRDVYAEFDRLRSRTAHPRPTPVADLLMQSLRSGDAAVLAGSLLNDLQPAALNLAEPLRKVLDLGESSGSLGGIVSGSGPTIAFLVPGPESALEVSAALTASGLVRRVERVTGPAPGARLLTGGLAGRH